MIALPKPTANYDFTDQSRTRSDIERELNLKQTNSGDHKPGRLILRSPDGTNWNITVNNAGVISATALP